MEESWCLGKEEGVPTRWGLRSGASSLGIEVAMVGLQNQCLGETEG